jgi:hypothetical protein
LARPYLISLIYKQKKQTPIVDVCHIDFVCIKAAFQGLQKKCPTEVEHLVLKFA